MASAEQVGAHFETKEESHRLKGKQVKGQQEYQFTSLIQN